MSYFRPDFHRYFANSFVDSILHKKSTLYYFLGRTYPWEDGSYEKYNEETQQWEVYPVSDDTNYPLTPDNAYANDITIRDNIAYVKKLESNNVTLSIRRINWEKGVTYYQWDSTKNMDERNSDDSLKTPYYVINSKYSVYKCLFNNHNSPSTVEPMEKSYGVLETDDGYIWKYMYSIPKIQLTRFLSGDYIPCQTAIGQSFYNLGAIESVVVRDGGMNYQISSVVKAIVDAPILHPVVINDTDLSNLRYSYKAIKSVTVVDGGSNYSSKATASVASSTGSGAEFVVKVTNGRIESVGVSKYGSGYLPTDSVYISDDTGKGATLSFEIFSYLSGYNTETGEISDLSVKEGLIYSVYENGKETDTRFRLDSSSGKFIKTLDKGLRAELELKFDSNGTITGVTITKRGRGYDVENPPSITIVDQYHTGKGKYQGNESAILTANVNGDSVDSITIVDGGVSYSSENTTKLVVIGDGSGCRLKPTIEGGKIIAVEVIDGGTGYTHAKINIVTSKEKGVDYGNADLIAVLGGGSISTDQSVVEQTAVQGAVYAIEVSNGGYGYSPDGTTVTLDGDGEGVSCVPVIADGAISRITVNDGGEGYNETDTVYIADASGAGEGARLSLSVDAHGTITAVNVLDCGRNYSSDMSDISISVISENNKGNGASLTPVIKDGVLRYINVTSYGKKYTHGDVIISDSHYRDYSEEEKVYADASAYPLISPIGGHGSDAVSELNANTATVYVALRYSDSFGTMGQEFRQFGVIANLSSYKNLVSTVYGIPVVLNDTNWLFNSENGLLSQKLVEPTVTIYNPNDSTDDGVQFTITKSSSLTNTVVQNHIDYVNVDKGGSNYASYPNTIVKAIDDSGKGSGAEFKPHIKGKITDVSVTATGYGFENTTVRVYDKDGNVDNDTVIFLDISRKGEILGGNILKSSSNHEEGKSKLEIVAKRSEDDLANHEAVLTPIVTDGKITGIKVDNHGANYRYSHMIVTDKSRDSSILQYYSKNSFPNLGNEDYTYIDMTLNLAYHWVWDDETRSSGEYVLIEGYTTTNAHMTPTITDGVIYSVTILSGGRGFDSSTTLEVEDAEGGSGSGAVLSAIIADGRITGVNVISGGSGYSQDAIVKVIGTGTDAEFKLMIRDGLITGVTLFDGGIDYRETATKISVDSNIEYFGNSFEDPTFSIAFEGSIDGISVQDSGSNYNASMTSIEIQDVRENPIGSGAVANAIISSNESTEVCLVPVDDSANNYTVIPSCVVKYVGDSGVNLYNIVDVVNKYIPIRTKVATNTVNSEENLCSVITLSNYNPTTNSYVGLTTTGDTILTIDMGGDTNTSNPTLYRVICISGKNIMVQPISFIPRELKGKTDTSDGNTVTYSFSEGGQTKYVTTMVETVVSNCTIDKYSGKMLYMANMRPVEFFNGKVLAVRTNLTF
jgi:hypothetical protein